MAYALGMSRDRYASVEYGRTPMSLEFALKLCSRFDVNEHWLATGKGDKGPTQHGLFRLPFDDPRSHLFSEALSLLPADKLQNRTLSEYALDKDEPTPAKLKALTEMLVRRVFTWMGDNPLLDDLDRLIFAEMIAQTGDNLYASMQRDNLKKQTRAFNPIEVEGFGGSEVEKKS